MLIRMPHPPLAVVGYSWLVPAHRPSQTRWPTHPLPSPPLFASLCPTSLTLSGDRFDVGGVSLLGMDSSRYCSTTGHCTALALSSTRKEQQPPTTTSTIESGIFACLCSSFFYPPVQVAVVRCLISGLMGVQSDRAIPTVTRHAASTHDRPSAAKQSTGLRMQLPPPPPPPASVGSSVIRPPMASSPPLAPPASSPSPSLPRDLDMTPLKRQVQFNTYDGLRLAYLPLSSLVFVSEIGGSRPAARAAAAVEAADLLRYRAQQLKIPLTHLLRSNQDGWSERTPVPPQDGDYITHRGFIEVLAYWMQQKNIEPGPTKPDLEPFPRLKRFAEYQAEIGEILFGVSMPSTVAPSTAASSASASSSSSSSVLSVAHLTPILPSAAVTLSTPPNGVDTIQEEIEAAGDAFAIPPGGIIVNVTRFDGRDLPCLTGRLIRVMTHLHLTSPMPTDRSAKQPISLRNTITGESATIEEYWAMRFFQYTVDRKDPTSNRRIRICQVLLDDDHDVPFILPADKLWRLDGNAGSADPNPAIESVGRDSASAGAMSRTTELWLQVEKEPFNLQPWMHIIADAQLTHDLHTIRHAYHSFLKVFPTSATHWKNLIELELTHKQYGEIERILPGALRTMPEIGLWKLYLVYQKLIHSPPPDVRPTEEQIREMNVAIETAYEFVLEHMGIDLYAGQVWKSYINFVRSITVSSPAEEVGKTASIRKLYQRVISTPIQPKELMAFWEEYQSFEKHTAQQFQNKTLMNKMIADYQNKFAMTHRESIERRKKYGGILSASLVLERAGMTQSAVHVSNRPSSSRLHQAQDALQIAYWIRFIRFESRKVEGQDMNVYKSRVVLAYRQALLYCRHYTNLWSDYLHFLMTPKLYFSADQIRIAWAEFKQAMPYSILPTLIHADVEEELKHTAEAKSLYETLLQVKGPHDPPAEEHSFRLPQSVVEERRRIRAADTNANAANASPAAPSAAPTQTSNKDDQQITVKEEQKEDSKEDDTIVDIYKGELHKIHPIVFILLMRFIRRSEGVDASRKVFLLARKSPSATYHTWLFAAYAEHHINNDLQKAQAIYAAGHRIYGDAMETYLLQYLNFLKETNDHNNLRLIFGRILLTESAESAESAQHLTRRENAQMRKANAASAAAAKDAAAAVAASIAAKENALTNESANDPKLSPDEWWAVVNGLKLDELINPTGGAGDDAASHSHLPPARVARGDRDEERRGPANDQPIPSATLLSLWASYVNFERDTANELAVLVKAEEKRDSKLAVRYSHKIIHWIDRWRFMDLWSCAPQLRQTLVLALQSSHARLGEIIAEELAADSERQANANGARTDPSSSSALGGVSDSVPRHRGILISDPSLVANIKSSVARPDLTRLSSFAAASQQFDRPAVRMRYGPATPVPDQILNVLSVLPPSHLFTGPYIHPQLIVDMLQQIPAETLLKSDPGAGASGASSTSTSSSVKGATGTGTGSMPPRAARDGRKRKNRDVADEEEEETTIDVNTPANDLYRKRQQQKLAAKQQNE